MVAAIFAPCAYFGLLHSLTELWTLLITSFDLETYQTHFCKIDFVFCVFTIVSWNTSSLHTQWRFLTSRCVWQTDVFDIHSIKRSWKDTKDGHKWSWKVLENAHRKVLESYRKPLSVYAPWSETFGFSETWAHPWYLASCRLGNVIVTPAILHLTAKDNVLLQNDE